MYNFLFWPVWTISTSFKMHKSKKDFFSFYKSLEAHLRMCNHPQGSQERKTICSLGVGCHLKPNSLMINIGAVAPFVTKYKYKYEEICVQHKYYKAIWRQVWSALCCFTSLLKHSGLITIWESRSLREKVLIGESTQLPWFSSLQLLVLSLLGRLL